MRSSSPFPPCWAASGHPRRRHRGAGGEGRGGAPSCSWTRCTASTRRSRMPSCPMSKAACSPSSARPPRTLVRGQLGLAVAGAGLRAAIAHARGAAAAGRPRHRGLQRRPGAGAAMRVEPDAREQLAAWADGDARRLISAVEVVAESAQPPARQRGRGLAGNRAVAEPAAFRQGRRRFLRPDQRLQAVRGSIRTRRCTGSAA